MIKCFIILRAKIFSTECTGCKRREKRLNIEKIKKNISKIIFVLVFIGNLCRLLINHENVQTTGWLGLIPLSILVVLTFYESKNTERAKVLFTIYWAFDFITGFSYLLKNINPVYFFMFPSRSWLFEIIYIHHKHGGYIVSYIRQGIV